MTNYERFLHLLEGETPDRLPMIHVWGYHPGHIRQWIDANGLPGNFPEDFLAYQRAHGHALGTNVEGWFSRLPKGEGKAGITSRYTQGGIRAGCSLRKFEKLGNPAELEREINETVSLNRRYGLGTRACVTNCFHALSGALGLEYFSYALYDDRDWLEEAMDQAERYNRRGIKVMIRNGVDMITVDGDIAYKTGPMISPETLREIWFDRTKETVRLIREAGLKVMYHTDGKVDSILPMLIEMGVDCFHGCEKQANDLGGLKAKFGRDITLIGNFDHAEMTFGTPELIAATTRQMLATGTPGGRYVPDINTIVPAECAVENFAAFVDTIRAFNAA
ncbi:MAG: uroporphyrinogen decarboxylase family protein [Oceanipulchritudo sp.]